MIARNDENGNGFDEPDRPNWHDHFSNDREAGTEDPIEAALDSMDDATYEVVEQPGDVFDVVAYCGKQRVGVLARTRYRAIADLLVQALFGQSDDAESEDA